jgi:hypothetical protein
MTIIEIIVLVVLIVLVAALAAYNVSKKFPPLSEMVEDVKDIEVKAEEIVSELYNKDLRPIVVKKPTKKIDEAPKSEFPIEKPKKKRKYYPKKKKE